MAGHSKWANIQHRKNKQDAKRGKAFTKLIRAITVAARLGGADLESNPRLRDAVIKAKNVNMPNDNIDRAIKKGAGTQEGSHMEEIIYEGYGPGGVAIMVECLTDNRNRTVGDVRHAFTKCGGHLGTDGSVSYLFSQQGQMSFPAGTDETVVMEAALEFSAEDVTTNIDGTIDVTISPENFDALKNILAAKGLTPDYADINRVAATQVALDVETAEKILKLQDMLEDLDDVQQVYSNADISTEILEKLEK